MMETESPRAVSKYAAANYAVSKCISNRPRKSFAAHSVFICKTKNRPETAEDEARWGQEQRCELGSTWRKESLQHDQTVVVHTTIPAIMPAATFQTGNTPPSWPTAHGCTVVDLSRLPPILVKTLPDPPRTSTSFRVFIKCIHIWTLSYVIRHRADHHFSFQRRVDLNLSKLNYVSPFADLGSGEVKGLGYLCGYIGFESIWVVSCDGLTWGDKYRGFVHTQGWLGTVQ